MTMRNNQLEQAFVAVGFKKQAEVRVRKPRPTQLHDVTEYKIDWDSLPQEARDAFSAMFSES
jgi:hypothetical protein